MNTNNKAIIMAVSSLASVLTGFIPGLNIVVPLVFWILWREGDPEFDRTGKNILNSQISWGIWVGISFAVFGPLCLILIGWIFIGILPLLWLIFTIIQTVNVANSNYDYVMPLTIRFLK